MHNKYNVYTADGELLESNVDVITAADVIMTYDLKTWSIRQDGRDCEMWTMYTGKSGGTERKSNRYIFADNEAEALQQISKQIVDVSGEDNGPYADPRAK